MAHIVAPSEAQILGCLVILPQNIEPSHADIARRYAEPDLRYFVSEFATDELLAEI